MYFFIQLDVCGFFLFLSPQFENQFWFSSPQKTAFLHFYLNLIKIKHEREEEEEINLYFLLYISFQFE